MTMTMLQRVARAISWADIKDTEASRNMDTGERKFIRDVITEEAHWVDEEKYLPMAKAAIEAMREPTQKMIAAGNTAGVSWESEPSDFRDAWMAMIDEAIGLQNKPEEFGEIIRFNMDQEPFSG